MSQFSKPCDRKSTVFNLNNADSESVVYEEVSDAFFEHTVSDMKVLQDSQIREANAGEPLMMQKMRMAKRREQKSHDSRVIIRFMFPDRNVIQAMFHPLETVNALYNFVSESLEKKGVDFELYTTPPKSILKDKTQILRYSGLAPMSLVYFSAKDTMESYLAAELLQNISSQSKAKKILNEYLPSKDNSVHGEMDGLSHQCAIASSGTASGNSGSKPSSDKVPASCKTDKSRKGEIEDFLAKHNTGPFDTAPVSELRHVIPLLYMEVYAHLYGHHARKVKHLWEKPPEDWPADVPFLDPNNKNGKDNHKPKKEPLVKMLRHLIKLYKTGNTGPASDEMPGSNSESLLEKSSGEYVSSCSLAAPKSPVPEQVVNNKDPDFILNLISYEKNILGKLSILEKLQVLPEKNIHSFKKLYGLILLLVNEPVEICRAMQRLHQAIDYVLLFHKLPSAMMHILYKELMDHAEALEMVLPDFECPVFVR